MIWLLFGLENDLDLFGLKSILDVFGLENDLDVFGLENDLEMILVWKMLWLCVWRGPGTFSSGPAPSCP